MEPHQSPPLPCASVSAGTTAQLNASLGNPTAHWQLGRITVSGLESCLKSMIGDG